MLLLVAVVLLVAGAAVPRPGWEWADETLRPPAASTADPSALLALLRTEPCAAAAACWDDDGCCCCWRLLPLRPRPRLLRRPRPLRLRRGLFFSGARRWQNLNTSPMPW